MEGGKAKLNFEEPQTTAAGEQLWIRTSKVPLRGPDQSIIGVMGTWQDITQEKRAMEAVRQAMEVAQEANRAKDYFLAVLSHELRTPLTPVLAIAQMLGRNTQLPPELREDMEMIRRNVALESQLIDDLLDVTRIERQTGDEVPARGNSAGSARYD